MMPLPLTRQDALASWKAFLPRVREYAARRNYVEAGHENVSRLSPALRYRLLTEDEVIRDTLEQHDFRPVEKWLQEVCWRRYWKGWLELRPQVWTSWRERIRERNEIWSREVLEKANAVAAGKSGVACMDALARELIETGYLHNHARMWWASFWIHAEHLPWEMGADFFLRHLLDADPASNTLSWCWVAGLQTPGKTYLVRRSNLEKYAPALLHDDRGSERIADGALTASAQEEFADTSKRALPAYPVTLTTTEHRSGLWLHYDDLAPEVGPLASFAPLAVAAVSAARDDEGLSDNRIAALRTVLADGLLRTSAHFGCPATLIDAEDPWSRLAAWARSHELAEVVALAPMVGPINDRVPQLKMQLEETGIRLTLVRRPSDAFAFSLAGAGFFPFWARMSKHLSTS